MQVDFSSLNTTISSILLQPESEVCNFVADFSAKAIYPKSDWKGLFWKYTYKTLDFVLCTSKSLEQSTREKSFKLSEKLFKDAFVAIDATNKKVAACYEKNKMNADEQDALRGDVVLIGVTLSSLFDLNIPFSMTQRINRVQLAFEKVLKRQLFAEKEIALLRDFEKVYAMACVESIMRKPMPQHAFLGLLNGEARCAAQEELQEWLACVKDKEVRLTPWLFHQALAGMIEVVLKTKVNSAELSHQVSSLEIALLKKGCKMFQREDQLYTKWLTVLSPGTVIDEKDGGGILLGESKQHPTFLSQGLVAFERQGHPDQLVIFGKSVALLGMWHASHKENGAMVPFVTVLKTDPQGRYLVIEKLVSSLEAIPFRRKFGKVAEEDEAKCDEIARLIAWMSSQKVTPKVEFQPAFIFFTSKGFLRTLVPLKTDEPFDYNKLENFVRIAANGNYLAFRYIMRRSELIHHPVALFYLKIVEEHLLGAAKHAIRDQAVFDAIYDQRVIERAQTMIVNLKELRQKLFLALIPQLVNKERQARDTLLQEISKALIEFQKDTGLPASDWKENEAEEIVISYLKSERKELFVGTKS